MTDMEKAVEQLAQAFSDYDVALREHWLRSAQNGPESRGAECAQVELAAKRRDLACAFQHSAFVATREPKP